MISIVNCGIGNLKSVTRSLAKLGQEYQITNNSGDIELSQKIVLAGVGSFDEAMSNIRSTKGLFETIVEIQKNKNIKFLGICLGMQLFFTKSEEGKSNGLGFYDDQVRKLKKEDSLIPHIGWNNIVSINKSSLTHDINTSESYFYFAHSYYLAKNHATTAITLYGKNEFTSIFEYDNLYGCQFHPEKSFESGNIFLKNFVGLP